MKTKRLLLIAGMFAAAVVTLGALAMLPTRPGVTLANYGRIKDSMNKVAVEALFGPPTDLSPAGIHWGELHNGKLTLGQERVVWGGDDGAAVIIFDEHDRIVRKNRTDSPRTFLQKVRNWLQLR
jgi:hypothetical protein